MRSIINYFHSIVCSHGKFLAIGKDDEIRKQFESAAFDNEIDATGKCIIPGNTLSQENELSVEKESIKTRDNHHIYFLVNFETFFRCRFSGWTYPCSLGRR